MLETWNVAKFYLFRAECENFYVSGVPTFWNICWTPVGRQYREKQYFKLIDIFKYNQTSFFDPWPPLLPWSTTKRDLQKW